MHVGLHVSEQNNTSSNKAVEMWHVLGDILYELMQNRLTPRFGVVYRKQSKFSLAIIGWECLSTALDYII